jgi:beta-mannosidase
MNSKTQQRVFTQQVEILKVSQCKYSFQWNITQNVAAYIWWVWELGDQPLFTLNGKLTNENTKQTTEKAIEGIGFRTVKLNQAESQGGKQFTMNLNGLDIYCRGGNYIPPEMSLAKTNAQTYKTVIQNARQQNFNMIRVWGGGQF